LVVKDEFHSFVERLLEAFFNLINIERIPLAKRVEVRTGLHVNCTSFLPKFKINIKNAQQ
jgi:hypothetical protein